MVLYGCRCKQKEEGRKDFEKEHGTELQYESIDEGDWMAREETSEMLR